MSENSIRTVDLANEQILEIRDKSRMIGTDTWLVKVVFRMAVKTDSLLNITDGTVDINAVKQKTGPEVVFEKTYERNFIKESMKDEIFDSVVNSFLNTNLKYLSHPDFPEKLIMKNYHDKI